jgi:putative ABC transport system permease protein
MLELKQISKIYKGKKINVQALKDVNLKFNDVGFVSVVGTSGCGKTTLLNLIGGLDIDYSGEIIFNNQNTKTYNSKNWDNYRSSHIGFVFQEYNLINTISVYDNIEMGLELIKISNNEKKQRILEISRKLGIETLLNKSPLELSGGQKQRVAIARAIIKKPSVILADEPTGALDSKTSKEIMDILKDISASYLVIMVTHNEILAKEYSDRIITMSDGNVISDCVCNEINDEKTIDSKKTKKIIPLLGLLKTSFNNLRKKLVRTLLMIFACSIGIVALCLVITVVSGMSLYIEDVQGQALRTYPITINSVVDDEEPEKDTIEYEEYPSDNKIHVIDTDPSYYGHVNTFTNEFMNHIRKMDKELYSAISYSGWVKTRLLSEYGNGYYMVSNYSFLKEIPYDYQYLEYEYDVL